MYNNWLITKQSKSTLSDALGTFDNCQLQLYTNILKFHCTQYVVVSLLDSLLVTLVTNKLVAIGTFDIVC